MMCDEQPSKARKYCVNSGSPETASSSDAQHSHTTATQPQCSSMDLISHVGQFKYKSPSSGRRTNRARRSVCPSPEAPVVYDTRGKLKLMKSVSSSSSSRARAVDENTVTVTTKMSPGAAGGWKKGKMVETSDDSDFSLHDSESGSSVSDSYSPSSKRRRKCPSLSANQRRGVNGTVGVGKKRRKLQSSSMIRKCKESTKGSLSKKLSKAASLSQSAGTTSPKLADDCEPDYQQKTLQECSIEMDVGPVAKRVRVSSPVKQDEGDNSFSSPIIIEDERDSDVLELFAEGDHKRDEADVSSGWGRRGVLLYGECVG